MRYVILAVLALAACSDATKTQKWLIDPPVPAGAGDRIGSAELRDVSLPEYAADQEVAFQTADGAVRSGPDDVWADSPQRAVTQSLARAISEASGATVIAEPWPLAEPPLRRIDVRVATALAGADGNYRLAGRYFIADEAVGGNNLARSFDIIVPMATDGPLGARISRAQSAALGQLAGQIARFGGAGTTIATRSAADPFALKF